MIEQRSKRYKVKVFLIYGIVFLNLINLPMEANAQINYNLALEKGTQTMEINHYDEQAWNITVDATLNPEDWFGGDADRVGAKSKITVLDWWANDMNTYGMFQGLIIPKDYLPTFLAIHEYGYNHTYIANKYRDYYFIWDKSFVFRSFSSNGFSNFSDFKVQNSITLRYPKNISKLLDNYNEFASIINNDTILQSLNHTLPILNGDDFLWHFVLERYTIGNPIINYLTTLIGMLECTEVNIQGNTLKIKRNGVQNYTAEVTYNSHGNLESFLFRNTEGDLIYEITSYYPKITVLIIMGIGGFSIVSIILFFLYTKKKKEKKHFDQIRDKNNIKY